MTEQAEQGAEAAGRIRAFLAARIAWRAGSAYQADHVGAFPKPGSENELCELNASDLEAVLAALDGAQGSAAELEGRVRVVEALLTSGPIGRVSGERYVRADYIRAALADENGDGASGQAT